MIEVAILFVLAFLWVLFAAISDVKTKEIPNWLNFSLVIFALAFRYLYSFFSGDGSGFLVAGMFGIFGILIFISFFDSSFRTKSGEIAGFFAASLFFMVFIWIYLSNPTILSSPGFSFFYEGLMGLGIFFLIGNLLNYGRAFAGGDAKLMVSLGAVLPIFPSILQNLEFMFFFIIIFLISGSLYGILMSLYLSLKNFKSFKGRFLKLFFEKKFLIIIFDIFAVIFIFMGLNDPFFAYLGIFVFIFPYFYLFLESVDESCMIKKVSISALTPGDWLYRDVKVGGKTIKASWDGLSEEEIKILKKKKQVFVRRGLAFAPVFLISLITLILSYVIGFFQYFSKIIGI